MSTKSKSLSPRLSHPITVLFIIECLSCRSTDLIRRGPFIGCRSCSKWLWHLRDGVWCEL